MSRIFLCITLCVLFLFCNTYSNSQVIKDKNSFISSVLYVFDSRENGFDSILTTKSMGDNKGFESKILLPGSDECYIKYGSYYAGYSFKDSIQAISFFKEIQGLMMEASKAYNAMIWFVPEPKNPYYLNFHIGDAEGFFWHPDLINLFQHVLFKDYKVKGGIPQSATDKARDKPFSLYLIVNSLKPASAYFTSKGIRINNNEITNLVKEIGFGKDSQMIQIKKNKKITNEGNTYESNRSLKGYKATIFETEDKKDIRNRLDLLMQWTGKKDQELLNKADSLGLILKAALPSTYCYVIDNSRQKIFFTPHPFTNENPDAGFVISYGVDTKRKNFYYLKLSIERVIEKKVIEKKEKEPELKAKDRKLIPFKNSGGKYGYKNEAGEIVVAAKYDEAAYFIEERARVVLNKKHGFIDIKGDEIVPLKYDYASYSFLNGLAEVELNRKYGMIDKTGKEIALLKYDKIDRGRMTIYNKEWDMELSNNFILVKSSGKFGFIDNTGREFVPLIYQDAELIGYGTAIVKLNNLWGIIEKTGKLLVPVMYDYIRTGNQLENNYVQPRLNMKYGLMDKTGKLIIAVKYDDVSIGFSENLAVVKLNNKYGFVDSTGKEVIPLKFESASKFSEGMSGVRLNNKWGFIDKTGKQVITFKYEYTGSFKQGLAAVKLNNKWGYIDKTGRTVIAIKYDYVGEFDKYGKAKVYLGKKWGKINTKGTIVEPIENMNSDDER